MSVADFLKSQGIEPVEVAQEQLPDYNISEKAGYLVDADTYALPSGEKVRLQGVNAREVPGFDTEKQMFKGGQYGGEQQQQIVQRVIEEQGFFNPVYDSKTKDATGTRYVGDLTNDKGEKLTDYLLTRGLISPTQYSTQEQINKVTIGRLDRIQRQEADAVDRFERAKRGEYVYSDSGDLYNDLLTAETSKVPVTAKPFALTAKQFGMNPEEYAGAAFIRPEETEKGFARSNLKTGLKSGWESMFQGLYGTADLVSTSMDYEPGKEWSDANRRRLQNELNDLPFLNNAEAFDMKTGKWKLDSFGKLFDYAVATAASSAPQMVTSIVATLAAPATFGASLSVPAAIYTGQIWNDQPEGQKSASWALGAGITSATLDALGIKGIAGSLSVKATRDAAVKELVKKGMTVEAAEQAIIAEARKTTKQLMDVVKAGAGGAASEAVTEVGQEFTQYLGSNLGEIKDPNELKNRLMNAGFGGGLLGGGIAGAGKAVANTFVGFENTNKPNDLKFREEMRNKEGFVLNASDIVNEALTTTPVGINVDLNKRAEPEESKRTTAGVIGTLKNWYNDKGLQSLFGKFSNTIIGDRGYRGKFSAALATILGANHAVNGGDLFAEQELAAGGIRSNLGNLKDLQDSFGGLKLSEISSILYRKDVIEYIKELSRYKKNKGDSDMTGASQNIDTSKLGADVLKYKDSIVEAANRIDNTISAFNRKTNLTKTVDDVVGNRPLNKMFIARNREAFIRDVKSALGLTDKQALEMYSSLMNNQNTLTAEDSIEDILGMNPAKGSKQQLTQNLHDANSKGLLDKYFSGNIFDNMEALAHKGGVLHVNNNVIGKDGINLAYLLESAVRENEITEAEASFMAKEIKDFLSMREGKYKQIQSPLVNGVIDTITFFSTLASLPLATISSLPEAAQMMRGLNTKQALKAYKRLLSNTAEEMGVILKEIGSRERNQGLTSRQALSSLGFATGDTNAATRYDVQSGYFQQWTNGFFKLIGLQGYTNATRYARLAIGADAINNWLQTLQATDFNKLTQQEQDAYEHLVRVGVDPFVMNDPAVDQQVYNQAMERGVYNFINEAVVHPNSLNRPKFYSDPYLRMFTMFQGYISTFTANILPRLYGDLMKKGSADQRNAMLTIASMLALTMLAITIKDMIKYGETPPEWLKGDDAKLMQRFIGATGLTGTGERVINFVNPLVEKKATNPAEKLYNILEGESPTLSFGAKVAKAANAVFSDEGTKPIKKVAGVAPIIGPINQLGDYLQNEFGGQ
jgi:hypothetical protein